MTSPAVLPARPEPQMWYLPDADGQSWFSETSLRRTLETISLAEVFADGADNPAQAHAALISAVLTQLSRSATLPPVQVRKRNTNQERRRLTSLWALDMLLPDRSVCIDVETTGFGSRDSPAQVIRIAAVDTTTGKILLNTFVNPGPAAVIEPGAAQVHRITKEMVTAPGVPDWPTVLRKLLKVVRGKALLAYKARFDQRSILADCKRHSLDPEHLAVEEAWNCVMTCRRDWEGSSQDRPLGGDHTPVGACLNRACASW
ncbi:MULTISPECIES: 3'-5' exonuclease [unclassified Crossiella]|uniref:3'-5' exonuclease n=1 Tax=unclassified Crossiella TaxID=2620835 RepID=UPI00200047FA|nr:MULTISPECIES: 3'-5' exonuclease [unclassified Crossiella]MCK2240046.1 3'-5' exonuclease [Crossiella sp. S99.2]MCK2252754.1 3'-5' exonuclease [Crossiella sp. S99.1]